MINFSELVFFIFNTIFVTDISYSFLFFILYITKKQPLVIDSGCSFVKCGFGGDDAPRAVFPTIYGRRKHGVGAGVQFGLKDEFVGDEAEANRGVIRVKYPVERGMVNNWNDMEKIWHHTFYNELRVSPEEHPVLLSENPSNLFVNQEKTMSIMFETYEIPAIHLSADSLLTLISTGRTMGCVLECGGGITTVVPIFDEHEYLGSSSSSEKLSCIQYGMKKLEIAGQDIRNYLIKLLCERGYVLTKAADREIVRDIKEKLGFVCLDYEQELTKSELAGGFHERDYELPDGWRMTIGSERFRSTEILFKPSFIGSELPGIHKMIHNSINQSFKDHERIQKIMYNNIVLGGGSSVFDGMAERLTLEIEKLVDGKDVRVVSVPTRKFSSWIGGSILSSLSTFESQWLTKREYEEIGSDGSRRNVTQKGCTRLIHDKKFLMGIEDNNSRVEFLKSQVIVLEERNDKGFVKIKLSCKYLKTCKFLLLR